MISRTDACRLIAWAIRNEDRLYDDDQSECSVEDMRAALSQRNWNIYATLLLVCNAPPTIADSIESKNAHDWHNWHDDVTQRVMELWPEIEEPEAGNIASMFDQWWWGLQLVTRLAEEHGHETGK